MKGASVMIEIYSNRLEISNPGEPVVRVERFIDGYQSRNERLASLMRRMGICEEKGSGIDRVVYTAEAFQFIRSDRRTKLGHLGPPGALNNRADFSRGERAACKLLKTMKS